MWTSLTESLDAGRTLKYSVCRNDEPLSYADVVALWQSDESFRTFFIELLADAPFAAYFWETPAVTDTSIDQPFQFVLLDSPDLSGVSADPAAFSDYFDAPCARNGVVSFPNFGKDALLLAPCPGEPQSAHAHLAVFVRRAPRARIHALWREVGRLLEQHIHQRPIWLSTAGLGVYWLHVRLDTQPKYYSFQPYRKVVRLGQDN